MRPSAYWAPRGGHSCGQENAARSEPSRWCTRVLEPGAADAVAGYPDRKRVAAGGADGQWMRNLHRLTRPVVLGTNVGAAHAVTVSRTG